MWGLTITGYNRSRLNMSPKQSCQVDQPKPQHRWQVWYFNAGLLCAKECICVCYSSCGEVTGDPIACPCRCSFDTVCSHARQTDDGGSTKGIKPKIQRAADTCYQNTDPMAPTRLPFSPRRPAGPDYPPHWQTGAHKKHSHQWTAEPFSFGRVTRQEPFDTALLLSKFIV